MPHLNLADRQQVGSHVKELRHRLGLTQLELAYKAGVADNTVRATERASKCVHRSTIKAIADALGVSIEVLTGTDTGDGPCP